MINRQCSDCKDGEHDNIDEDIKLVCVKDPVTKKIVKRAYMCRSHQNMYENDGYEVNGI